MNSLSRFARTRPIVSYFLLTMVWSFFWWGLILTVTPAGTLMVEPMKPAAFGLMMLGLIGPTFASIVLTRTVYGRGSVRSLYSRLRWWRLGIWGFVVFFPLVVNLVQFSLYRLLGGNAPVDFAARIPMGLMLGLTASLLEEFGWRGFLLPHLQKHHSPFVSALIVGLIWGGVWHGFADYLGIPQEGATKLALILLLGPVLLTAYSVMLTALYNGTHGSMLSVVLFHFFISSSGLILEVPAVSDNERIIWALAATAFAWLLALVVAIRSGMFARTSAVQPKTA